MAAKAGRLNLSARTMYIKVSPAPITFAERRAVLQALQRHGDIEVFKKLDHNSSAFMSVAKTTTTVATLSQKSPLHYDLVTPRTRGSVSTFLANYPSGTLASRPQVHLRVQQADGAALSDDEQADFLERRGFTLHVWASPDYPHQKMLVRSPLYGQWEAMRANNASPVAEALRKRLPRDVASEGLADWESLGQTEEDPDVWAGFGMRAGRRPHPIKVMNGLDQLREEAAREGVGSATATATTSTSAERPA